MPERFEIRQSQDNQFYFVLIAPNNEVVATSETYKTKAMSKKGIEAVKKYAPTAPIGEEREQGGHLIEKLFPSLALSIFGSVGLTLLLIITGLFEENAGQAISTCLFSGFPFVAIAWIWLFSSVFISTKLVEPSSPPRILAETFLSVNSFLAVGVSGMLCMYLVMSGFTWWWLITIIALGGLCAVIHGWFLYFQRIRNSIISGLAKIKGDERTKIFVKSLELEHNFFQSYFQGFVSVVIIFITAAVVSYYIRGEQIASISIVNASLMVAWVLIGLFFGIFIPIQKHMEYIRKVVRDIAVRKPEKQ